MDLGDLSQRNSVFFIIGATGTGKSLAAVKVARTLLNLCGFKHVVIINCDVMQFYANLSIATNKVSSEDMEGIPHLFIGFLSPSGMKIRDPTIPYKGCDQEEYESVEDLFEGNQYNIHSYVHDVVEFIENFFSKHAFGAVVICGGTCYYAQALMFKNVLTEEDSGKPVSFGSESDFFSCDIVRAKSNLWDELNKVDPVVAVRYHPNDSRRISRLLEIYKKTNRLPSEIYASRPKPEFRYPSRFFVLWTHVDHEKLKKILEERVDKMASRGVVDEFLELAKRQPNVGFDFAIAKAIGFKEFTSAVMMESNELRLKGEKELNNSIELLKTNTKRYARQQNQWIKNRFLGRFWSLFTSQMDLRNFVCIDGSKTILEFVKNVEMTTEFLMKPELQAPDGVSFPLRGKMGQFSEVQQEWCPVCELFVCGGNQKNAHLDSKRHRRAVKRASWREEEEQYGRVILSRFSGKTKMSKVKTANFSSD